MSNEGIGFGAFVALLVALIAYAAWASWAERADWVDQCVADGNKPYECEERYDRAHPPAPVTNVHTH